ncbi:MAG: hypothetical protein AAGC70_03595 [Pseudomonadota bacterium]
MRSTPTCTGAAVLPIPPAWDSRTAAPTPTTVTSANPTVHDPNTDRRGGGACENALRLGLSGGEAGRVLGDDAAV